MTTLSPLPDLWRVGVEAVKGEHAVAAHLKRTPCPAPDLILAVGKAATSMAKAALAAFPGTRCLIVTKYDHTADAPAGAQIIEAAHPVPDTQSIAAGAALRASVATCAESSHLLMLVSGGASSLAECLPDNMNLEDLARETQAMLASGADIHAMNARRSEISLLKGGKLLAGFKGARVTTLALSDVEGDALSVIGSGIGDALKAGFEFQPHIVASNAIARTAIAEATHEHIAINTENLYQNVSDLAPKIGAQLRDGSQGMYIFGGEPTVILPDQPGLGGRNMALGLALAREIKGLDIEILVAGTDGTDGPTDAAGAFVNGTTWEDGAESALERADAYPWLDANGALFKSGPTGTNVMDILIARKA